MRVRIHGRIPERHPEISKHDVIVAWKNSFVVQERFGVELPNETLVALGTDPHGRVLEMIAVTLIDGTTLVYHAMTPPTKKVLEELGRWIP